MSTYSNIPSPSAPDWSSPRPRHPQLIIVSHFNPGSRERSIAPQTAGTGSDSGGGGSGSMHVGVGQLRGTDAVINCPHGGRLPPPSHPRPTRSCSTAGRD